MSMNPAPLVDPKFKRCLPRGRELQDARTLMRYWALRWRRAISQNQPEVAHDAKYCAPENPAL